MQLLPAHEVVAAHDTGRFGTLPSERADDAHAPGILAKDTGGATRFELLHAMQRQSQDVLEDALAERQLCELGDARRLPTARHVEQELGERDHEHAEDDRDE
jgi:hypothetical protein